MLKRNNRMILHIKPNPEKIHMAAFFAFITIVCLPFHTLTIGGIGLLMITSIPMFAATIPAFVNRLKSYHWDKAIVLLMGFFAYNLLAYAWTPTFSLDSIYTYIKIIVIAMCLYCMELNGREKRLLLAACVIASLIVCWFILTGTGIQYINGRSLLAIFGVTQDPNYLGYLFLIPIGISVSGFIGDGSALRKIFYVALGSLVLFCVLMTGSRGALLGVMAVTGICIVTRFEKMWQKVLFCMAMVVVVVAIYAALIMLLPDSLAARFTIEDIIKSRGTYRLDIWIDAISAMAEKPYRLIFGFGNGSSREVIGNGYVAHNFLIQLVLELGIVGTYLFFAFLWTWCKRLAKKDTMCLGVLAGCMAMSLTLSVNKIYYFWVVFIIGIVCAKDKQTLAKGTKQ